MTKHETRQARLLKLIESHYDGNKGAFADAMGKKRPLVYRLFSVGKSRRNIGEDLAREIEGKHPFLAKGWLDQTDDADDGPAALTDALNDWRLQASARSQRVIDQLTLLARKNELSDADWALIEDLAARFRKKEPPK